MHRVLIRLIPALLFLTLGLGACASRPTLRATDTVPAPLTVTPAYEGCAYRWAYQDLPDLTSRLDTTIKELDGDAKAWATAFGEDCVRANGQVTFGAIETDFYVHQPVVDLSDYDSFGSWIVVVMKILDTLPPDLIVGPQPGFVEFWFIKSEGEHNIVRVPLQKYRSEAIGKDGEELFRLFYVAP